ncbi:hypothetical protein [Actinomadura roseirufa]|uniref:hypothetical protein n=1 Tax=Actinomadura roseirufa TaxID=2094049 RepID=UPI001041B056|nr:hypothetical protein [Actinomadura roseirufa]
MSAPYPPAPYLTDIGWAGSALRLEGRIDHDVAAGIELHLRERDGGGLVRVPAEVSHGNGGAVGFEVLVDVASVEGGGPLPGGLWEVSVALGWPAMETVLPFGRDRAPGIDDSPLRRFLPGSTTVAAYFETRGALAIDVGGRPRTAGSTVAHALGWDPSVEEVVVRGHLDIGRPTTPISGMLGLRERRTRQIYAVIAMLEEHAGGYRYTARVPVTHAIIDDPLPRGEWEASLCVGFSGMHREVRILAPEEPVDVRVWRRLRHVRVVSTAAPEPLTVMVGRA